MTTFKNFINHFRFTLIELISNLKSLSINDSIRFFLMRLLLPFGFFSHYFLNRRSPCFNISSIDHFGFVELQKLEPERIEEIISNLLAVCSTERTGSFKSIEEYADTLRSSNVQRQSGLISKGDSKCPLAQVARSAAFADLAAEYLEIKKEKLIVEATVDTLVSTNFSKLPGDYDNALEFHRDIDAYKFFKIFIYLTDCFDGYGHHEIYLGSHRYYPLQLVPIKRYHAHIIEKYIPKATLKKVTGSAGYAFGENTLAFHRGTSPIQGHRVVLNLTYTEDTFKNYYFNAFPVSTADCSSRLFSPIV